MFFAGVFLAFVARAQPALPENTLAWAYLDASRLGPASDAAAQRAVITSIATWLAPERVIQHETTERLIGDMVNESLVHALPISFCVFSAAEEPGDPDRPPPASLRPVRFSAALSIRAGEHRGAVAQRIRETLKDTTHAEVSLAGVSAHQHRRADWPEWRVITWAEREDEVCIGFGPDAPERWFASPPADEKTPIERHRDAAPAGETIGEVFVNIDELRRAFPDRFGDDAGSRLLSAFHLANARSFMAHVRAADAQAPLTIDATWSVRSEPRTAIRRVSVAAPIPGFNPALDAPHAILSPAWSAWVGGGLDAYAAILGERDAREFARSRRTWASRRVPALARLDAAAAPGVSMELAREGAGCALGAFIIRFPLRQGANERNVVRDFRSLWDPFAHLISTDDREETWWLRAKAPSPIRAMSWGLAPSARGEQLILAIDLGTETDWVWTVVGRIRAER